MLCLERGMGESIVINGNVTVTVLEIKGRGVVKLGIEAPPEVSVHREEIQKRIDAGEAWPPTKPA